MIAGMHLSITSRCVDTATANPVKRETNPNQPFRAFAVLVHSGNSANLFGAYWRVRGFCDYGTLDSFWCRPVTTSNPEWGIHMGAGTGKRALPVWRVLYEAAVLELDRAKLLQTRIPEAEHAIGERIKDLNRFADVSEAEALANALTVLRDLRKMAVTEEAS